MTNKGVGGLLKRWGEGASLVRNVWKPREGDGVEMDIDEGKDEDEDGDEDFGGLMVRQMSVLVLRKMLISITMYWVVGNQGL